MVLTNEELKKIYFGAYEFAETEDGYLQAFQYTKDQIEYFKGAFFMWMIFHICYFICRSLAIFSPPGMSFMSSFVMQPDRMTAKA